MNRKDIVSLMEAYDEISLDRGSIDNSMETSNGLSPESPVQVDVSSPEPKADLAQLQDFQNQEQKMTIAHLHAIRSHANEINSVIENGALVEPWMEEKIAIANDYIINVANAIMYRK